MNQAQKDKMNAMKWWHRIELSKGIITPGFCSHGHNGDFKDRWGLEESYAGKSVLDVGAWDGLFSFEAEKRGASKVTAIDIYQYSQFNVGLSQDSWNLNQPFAFAKEMLNSNVEFHNMNVMDLPTSNIPEHDVVFFYGVFYHLDEPLKALQNLAYKTKETLLIETAICPGMTAMMEFKPGYLNDITNRFYPTSACVITMLKHVGFKEIVEIYNRDNRATFRATK